MIAKKNKYKPFLIAATAVIILWGFNWFLLTVDPSERGIFGDMFGAVNSLFTGLSFAGIIYAMYLQNKELSLQRQELRDTRTVMKEQSETIKLQTAESTFFRLLENHRSLVSSLSFSSGKNGYEGLNHFYGILKKETTEYYQAAMTGKLVRSEVSRNYPMRKLKYQIENVEQISENAFHIINFISHKLENGKFYHETFYNSLSKAEKYILGLYIINAKKDQKSVFQNHTFNYLEYFEGSGNSYFNTDTVPFFPDLSFQFVNPNNHFDINDYRRGLKIREPSEIKITVIENELGLPIKLMSTKFIYNWHGEMYCVEDVWNEEIRDSLNINLMKTMDLNLFSKYESDYKNIRDLRHAFHFGFRIDFIFLYKGKEFSYGKNFRLEFAILNSFDSPGSVLTMEDV